MDVIETTHDTAGILTIILNRPEKRNAINQTMMLALADVFAEARNEPSIRGIILTGAASAFCAGADIGTLAGCDATTGFDFALAGQAVFRALETLGKPSVAAVNGMAFGGGCELALSATARIASSTALFAQPEVKLGVIPGYGGTQRLARLVGKGRAMDACVRGHVIDAQTALMWGLVTEVVPDDTLLSAANTWLTTVLSMAPLAIKSVMEVIDTGYDLPLTEALALEALHFGKLCGTKDKNTGVQAFLSKTQAQFEGV